MGDMMINKQGLLFLTLTSLILVLSVYYITMPTELLLTTNSSYLNTLDEEVVDKVDNQDSDKVIIKNGNTVTAMKSILNEERQDKVKELNNKLISKELSLEEKNNIYEELKNINKYEIIEEDIQSIIKNEYNLDSFIKVSDDVIEVTIISNKHDTTLAAKIMTSIEKKYNNMYISISFKT